MLTSIFDTAFKSMQSKTWEEEKKKSEITSVMQQLIIAAEIDTLHDASSASPIGG